MAKRVSNTQLTHDNWDQEEEKEEPGLFSAASEEQLKNRVFKKARRILNTSNDSSGSASASPFRAFTGFASKPLSVQPNFNFLPQSAKAETQSSSFSTLGQSVQNGRSESSEEIKCKEAAETSSSASEKSTLLGNAPQPSSASLPKDQDFQYFKMLRNLNESVMKWMQMHYSKNPCCNFCPVFNDYKNYVQQLEVKYMTKSNKTTTQSSTSMSSSSSFKIPDKTEWMRTPQSKSDFFKSASSDESQKSSQEKNNEPEMKYGASFPSNTTNTSTVSFGFAKYPTETSGSQGKSTPKTTEKSNVDKDSQPTTAKPFTFGGFGKESSFDAKSVVENSDKKLFNFTSTPNTNTTDSACKGDDDYVPPRNEVAQITEEDAVYTKRCKLFSQKNNEYVDRGVGTLYLKPINGKMQLLIRADTNLGNILLNIMLSASLPMQRTGKNNVLIVCVPNPPIEKESGDGDSKKAVPLLIRVKTSEDADELLEMLNKHKS